MSVRKRIGNVCLICGGLIVASGHVQHECRPSVELCAPSVAVLPDAPHPEKTPGPVVRVIKVVTSVSSSVSSSWIGAQNFRWLRGDKT
jgi:hypothetical protein